jgi:hypothetical protein
LPARALFPGRGAAVGAPLPHGRARHPAGLARVIRAATPLDASDDPQELGGEFHVRLEEAVGVPGPLGAERGPPGAPRGRARRPERRLVQRPAQKRPSARPAASRSTRAPAPGGRRGCARPWDRSSPGCHPVSGGWRGPKSQLIFGPVSGGRSTWLELPLEVDQSMEAGQAYHSDLYASLVTTPSLGFHWEKSRCLFWPLRHAASATCRPRGRASLPIRRL